MSKNGHKHNYNMISNADMDPRHQLERIFDELAESLVRADFSEIQEELEADGNRLELIAERSQAAMLQAVHAASTTSRVISEPSGLTIVAYKRKKKVDQAFGAIKIIGPVLAAAACVLVCFLWPRTKQQGMSQASVANMSHASVAGVGRINVVTPEIIPKTINSLDKKDGARPQKKHISLPDPNEVRVMATQNELANASMWIEGSRGGIEMLRGYIAYYNDQRRYISDADTQQKINKLIGQYVELINIIERERACLISTHGSSAELRRCASRRIWQWNNGVAVLGRKSDMQFTYVAKAIEQTKKSSEVVATTGPNHDQSFPNVILPPRLNNMEENVPLLIGNMRR